MEKNENNEWFVFNREYLPLGCNEQARTSQEPCRPVYTAYNGLTNTKVREIVEMSVNIVLKDNELHKVFFYHDGTNPTEYTRNWVAYAKILQQLSTFRAITK